MPTRKMHLTKKPSGDFPTFEQTEKDKKMNSIIFSGFGCTILCRDGRYFIRYDSGGIASWLLENEIPIADVEKAMKSEKDAYEVILSAERERKPSRVVE